MEDCQPPHKYSKTRQVIEHKTPELACGFFTTEPPRSPNTALASAVSITN